jgi:hypothetical protein
MSIHRERVVACPYCGARARAPIEAEVPGAARRRWTDGHSVVPGSPRRPRAPICEGCHQIFLIEQGLKVSPRDAAEAPAAPLREPSEDEFYRHLTGLPPSVLQEERSLRLLAWRRGNDLWRESPPPSAPPLDPLYEENLTRLVRLLDGRQEPGRLLRAEALRELGRFQAALIVLEIRPFPRNLQKAASLVTHLARKKDRLVREVS